MEDARPLRLQLPTRSSSRAECGCHAGPRKLVTRTVSRAFLMSPTWAGSPCHGDTVPDEERIYRSSKPSRMRTRVLEKLGAIDTAIHVTSLPEPSSCSTGTVKDENIADFDYASKDDLENPNTMCLIGKRVGIKNHVINVLNVLGCGRTGRTFRVQVVEPAEQSGLLLALKFRTGVEAIAQLRRESLIMIKLAEEDVVPHVVSMVAYGRLKAPRNILFGGWVPKKSTYGLGLLVTLAPGLGLKEAAPCTTYRPIICKQLTEFAEAMYAKQLIHGDLTYDNVFWDQGSRRVTVIDFGNALDTTNATTLHQRAALAKKQNAKHEMHRFLEDLSVFRDAKADPKEVAPELRPVVGYVFVSTVGSVSHQIALADCPTLISLIKRVATIIGVCPSRVRLTSGDRVLNDNTIPLCEYGIVDGAQITAAITGGSIIQSLMDEFARCTVVHNTLLHDTPGLKDVFCTCLDERLGRLYLGLRRGIGFIDLTTDSSGVAAACPSTVRAGIGVADNAAHAEQHASEGCHLNDYKLLVEDSESVQHIFVDGSRLLYVTEHKFVSVELAADVALDLPKTVLLDNLPHMLGGVAITSDHSIYFIEFESPASNLCRLRGDGPFHKEIVRKLPCENEYPGGFVCLDADGDLFAVGTWKLPAPSYNASIMIVPRDADCECRKVVDGQLATNMVLALDSSGCLYCAGRVTNASEETRKPCLEAFPNFASVVKLGEPVRQRVVFDDTGGSDNVGAMAVGEGGDIYYVTADCPRRLRQICLMASM